MPGTGASFVGCTTPLGAAPACRCLAPSPETTGFDRLALGQLRPELMVVHLGSSGCRRRAMPSGPARALRPKGRGTQWWFSSLLMKRERSPLHFVPCEPSIRVSSWSSGRSEPLMRSWYPANSGFPLVSRLRLLPSDAARSSPAEEGIVSRRRVRLLDMPIRTRLPNN
jgi:hypothetical protein